MEIINVTNVNAGPGAQFYKEVEAGYPWRVKIFSISWKLEAPGVDGLGVIRNWVMDNIGYYPMEQYAHFFFKTADDAAIFKLAWA